MATKPGQNSTDKKAPKRLPTLEMIISLAGFIAGVLARLSFEEVKHLLGNKNTVLRKALEKVFEITADPYAEVRAEWQKFYQDHFKMVTDFSEVVVRERPKVGSWRLIFIPMGLSMNATLAIMRSKFQVWVYAEDLDASVTVNTRTSTMSYAVWVRDGVEPDGEFLGKSTRDSDMAGSIGMTLLERMVFEVKYFVETGQHLDNTGMTFCTGSRYTDGHVPYVYWLPNTSRVYVNACTVDNANPTNGLRQKF